MNIANRIKKLEKVTEPKDDMPMIVFKSADPSKEEEFQRELARAAERLNREVVHEHKEQN